MAVKSTRLRVDILTEHAEEIEILWARRREAVWSPRETLDSLATLEQRLDAHIDGLALDADATHECFERGLAGDDRDTAFTSAATLLRQGTISSCRRVLDALPPACIARHGAMIGIRDALRYEALHPSVEQQLTEWRRMGVRFRPLPEMAGLALDAHRSHSHRAVYPSPQTLRECSCRAGSVRRDGAFLLGCAGQDEDLPRLVEMVQHREQVEAAIRALGSLGRPAAVEALLDMMRDDATAPAAGEAFWRITGLAVVPRADAPPPDGDEHFEETRPWPDVTRTRDLWKEHSAAFAGDGRWRYGTLIDSRRWLSDPHTGDLLTRREEISRLRTEKTGALHNLDLDAPARRQRLWAPSGEAKP